MVFTPEKVLYHRAVLNGCSFLAYHTEVITMKHGSMSASNTPSKNLTAERPAKFERPAMPQRHAPQQKSMAPKYLPIRYLGQEPQCREFHAEITEIEDRAQPAIFPTFQMDIFLHSVDCCVCHSVL